MINYSITDKLAIRDDLAGHWHRYVKNQLNHEYPEKILKCLRQKNGGCMIYIQCQCQRWGNNRST